MFQFVMALSVLNNCAYFSYEMRNSIHFCHVELLAIQFFVSPLLIAVRSPFFLFSCPAHCFSVLCASIGRAREAGAPHQHSTPFAAAHGPHAMASAPRRSGHALP
jgi:hypothetical protein